MKVLTLIALLGINAVAYSSASEEKHWHTTDEDRVAVSSTWCRSDTPPLPDRDDNSNKESSPKSK